jgi:hypothetical protein
MDPFAVDWGYCRLLLKQAVPEKHSVITTFITAIKSAKAPQNYTIHTGLETRSLQVSRIL